MGNRQGKGGDGCDSASPDKNKKPVKKQSFFGGGPTRKKFSAAETLTQEEDRMAAESIQRSFSVPSSRKRQSTRYGYRGRRKCIQMNNLLPEQCYLIQLSWRCLTVAMPELEVPELAIFNAIFIKYPQVKSLFGMDVQERFNCSQVSSFDVEDKFGRHSHHLRRGLDLVMRNVDRLDGIPEPYLIKIGADHGHLSGQGFKEEYFEAFGLAMSEYLSEVLRNEPLATVLTSAVKNAQHSSDVHPSVREYICGLKEKDPMHTKDFILEDAEEAWRSLVLYMISKISFGYQNYLAQNRSRQNVSSDV